MNLTIFSRQTEFAKIFKINIDLIYHISVQDLMRSVGKIERDDWNVKEIERKIMENRLGRPEPKTAEKVPKWDREQVIWNTFFNLL